ncbi:membrane protein DedA with SNARE-associated domain [Actinoplanes campanulatus]|uniref:Membrane protein DedA with SNARE-associated domain n=1 Tax=Actinoplanes campanulatus TaxID=113559 RepID=A0A7W5AJH6_9ACTN|nr:DedA family protein [Actinoplanes campanulatus]MBB3097237.1 membrane protein DedA with SNARE-associated domain [Actinoplanes campanulatus]GGN16713.1 membrane protein [Actinoplanes campanulatus]GID37580.1 membrane protein [Actinoplanes campanulatus]
MTEMLTMLAVPAWAYLALFAFLAVDALVPVVPTQAIMITSGALTVYGDLDLAAVVAVGAVGMFTGDLIAFVLGRSTGARLSALRDRFAPRNEESESKTRRAAARFTRGLRRPGPLVVLLCRFVPGGRMASGYHAGRSGYPIKSFIGYDVAAALSWACYGGLVGHLGGTAITQSAWRLFAVAATAALIFGTAGWILALFGGRDQAAADGPATGSRAASADAPPRRSSRRATDRS